MLKLMRFPRGTNRNRTLKPQTVNYLAEVGAAEDVETIFRRFWRERALLAASRARAGGERDAEEVRVACD